MKKVSLLLVVALIAIIYSGCCPKEVKYSGNPLFTSPLTADPSALVYNDTLYLFTGSDEQAMGRDGFMMRKWYVFSTGDMVNWTNHGAVLKVEDFEWARSSAFAGHCTERDGKFYWYVPMIHKDSAARVNEGFAIGVAVADHPAGPYSDATGKPIIADTTKNSIVLNIDPCTYVDDDGQAYMFWGSWSAARVVKLKDNMVEVDGPVQTVEAKNFFEAPWIHKKGETYFLSYAAHYPSTTEYSTSKSIMGPWEYRGVINDVLPNSPTNHQAIVTFKGNDYFIYHNAGLSDGGPYRRSVCIDKLEYDEEGKIKRVVRTHKGVPQI